MIGYSEQALFDNDEIVIYKEATRLVSLIPDDRFYKIRCHELARCIGCRLNIPFTDGKYGLIEHSWCWTKNGKSGDRPGNILDVYSIARSPMVQLVKYDEPGVLAITNRQMYTCYPFNILDIDTDIMNYIYYVWKNNA